ncbi:MAG TPA: sigma-70 family RNA polymerase sigma factor [Candidatus Polarisedimenticolaceae bacterium]
MSVPREPDGAIEHSSEPEIGHDQLRARLAEAVRRICPWWLRSQADDLVGVAITRIVAAQESREGNWRATPFYVQRAAFSALVDEIRRRRRSREVQAPEGLEEGMIVDERGDPERAAASREIARGLRACLATLAADRRLACVVRLQGHSVPEGARILGWSEKRTENLVYRGMADLRRCLEAKGLKP